jgi:hypothetical protein
MGAVLGWLLVLVVAAALTVVGVRWLLPRDPDAPTSVATGAQRALDAAARLLARGSESRLARVQRLLYARAIEELPRSRGGTVHLPGRVEAVLSAADATAIAGFEQVVEVELADELQTYVAKFSRMTAAKPSVHVSCDPALAAGEVRIEMSQPTLFDGPPASGGTELFPSSVLVLVSDRGGSVPLLDRALVAGRAATCDLVVADPRVSARHCEFAREGDAATVTDVGSTNGTAVNGAPISSRVALHPGDQVRIGSTTLTVTRP